MSTTPPPRRRRPLTALLAVVFLVVPLIELYVLIQVGQVIGGWPTIGLLLLSAVLGGWLVRREGRRAWTELSGALRSGRMPARELADAGLVLTGGLLMVAPGFVTDVVGLLLVLPVTRPVARRALTGFAVRRASAQVAGSGVPGFPGAGRPGTHHGPPPGGRRPAEGPDVVRGEVVDDPPRPRDDG